MSHVNTISKQFTDLIPRNQFISFVNTYDGDKHAKGLTCWMQCNALLAAQVKGWNSLREIEIGMKLQNKKLYHMGIEPIARSTLSYANRKRGYQIYESLFYKLLPLCKDKVGSKKKFRFKNKLLALDSSTIDLCLSLFPWAKFRQTKGAIKLHNLMDVNTQIPEVLVVTNGKEHDVTLAKRLDFSPYSDSIVVFDRAYEDFKWWSELDEHAVCFVTRLQKNVRYQVVGQHKKTIGKGVISDEVIELTGVKAEEKYPKRLRLITYYDKENDKLYRFITNNFKLAAKTIANIYKSRWDIEIFFKWIKQNLKIKTFLGTNKNAVLTQIWIAMIYYLLLKYIKHQTKYDYSLTVLTQVMKDMYFERLPLIDLLSDKFMSPSRAGPDNACQLAFF